MKFSYCEWLLKIKCLGNTKKKQPLPYHGYFKIKFKLLKSSSLISNNMWYTSTSDQTWKYTTYISYNFYPRFSRGKPLFCTIQINFLQLRSKILRNNINNIFLLHVEKNVKMLTLLRGFLERNCPLN